MAGFIFFLATEQEGVFSVPGLPFPVHAQAIPPGGVSAVSATFPVVSSGGATPNISLAASGVAAGLYTNATISVDALGRVVAANNGTPPVTAVTASAPLASSGGLTPNITHNASGVAAGAYTNASITVDANGHVTAAANGAAPVTSVTGTAPVKVAGTATAPVVQSTFPLVLDSTGTYAAPNVFTTFAALVAAMAAFAGPMEVLVNGSVTYAVAASVTLDTVRFIGNGFATIQCAAGISINWTGTLEFLGLNVTRVGSTASQLKFTGTKQGVLVLDNGAAVPATNLARAAVDAGTTGTGLDVIVRGASNIGPAAVNADGCPNVSLFISEYCDSGALTLYAGTQTGVVYIDETSAVSIATLAGWAYGVLPYASTSATATGIAVPIFVPGNLLAAPLTAILPNFNPGTNPQVGQVIVTAKGNIAFTGAATITLTLFETNTSTVLDTTVITAVGAQSIPFSLLAESAYPGGTAQASVQVRAVSTVAGVATANNVTAILERVTG